MFNLSIRSSKFLSVWENALVIPIPKTGNLTKVQNSRPVFLLPLPGKILEKVVHQQMSNHLCYLTRNTVFAKNACTVHSAAQLITFVNKKLDIRTPTLAVFVNFKKLFDCEQRPVLLNKLTRLNMNNSVIASRTGNIYLNLM